MFSKLKSVFHLFHKKSHDFIDITKYGYEQYQDIIINNVIVKKASGNHPESELRYKIIQKVLNLYQRPFEMLDIGASQGYYSFRAAQDYDCVCVMIEGNNPSYPKVGNQLLDLCKANSSLDNIILLNKEVIVEDLRMLSECENFSVVLALNIIHWFGARWKECADAILAMGDNIIIETPPQEDIVGKKDNELRKSIEEYLILRGAKNIGEVPRHTSDKMATLYLFESEKTKLTRKHWLSPIERLDHLTITCDYNSKKITKKLQQFSFSQVSDWLPGINLITFLMYNGAYPPRKQIKKALKNIADITHNDWTANNMILQGNRLCLIDYADPSHGPDGGRRSTSRVLKSHLRFIGIKNPAKIVRYFYNRLIKT